MLARKIYDLQIDINVKRTFFSSSLNSAHSILVPSQYPIHAFLPTRSENGRRAGREVPSPANGCQKFKVKYAARAMIGTTLGHVARHDRVYLSSLCKRFRHRTSHSYSSM